MRRQVRQLVETDRPNMTIEIVPFRAGMHPGMNGSFMIHEFPDAADDDVLFLADSRGDMISSDDPEEILSYREAFDQLQELSLGADVLPDLSRQHGG